MLSKKKQKYKESQNNSMIGFWETWLATAAAAFVFSF